MDEYLKCIKNTLNDRLTINKIYKVVGGPAGTGYVSVIDDIGEVSTYYSCRFEPVTQEKENTMYNDHKARTMVQNRSYLVGSFDATGKFSIASEPSEHLTEQKAKTEAKRLAGLHGEKTFVVMQLKAGFKTVQIQEI